MEQISPQNNQQVENNAQNSKQVHQQKAQPDAKKTTQGGKKPIQAKQSKQPPPPSPQGQKPPLQAKQRPIQAKQVPVQRQSTKSENIAQAMGDKYNVDTSGLNFTHNSTFPGQVNAEATIQGNKIDFAPGKDTESNIKHEVGHYIINTQRGTPPKADTVVNGQSVNTTDEVAADKMAATPLQLKADNTQTNQGSTATTTQSSAPVQRQVNNSSVIQRVAYGNLQGFKKAKVDQQSNKKYEQKAMEYEQLLGKKFADASQSKDIANKMLRLVRKIVNAWATATGKQQLATYEQEFKFDEGDKYYGAFKMTGANIKRVFDSLDTFGKEQPTRKKLKVIYNAIRNNNLAKWLKVASDIMQGQTVRVLNFNGNSGMNSGGPLNYGNVTGHEDVNANFATNSGLRTILNDSPDTLDRVQKASQKEKRMVGYNNMGVVSNVNSHISAPDAWSGLARGKQEESSKIDTANKDRLYNQNKNVPYTEQNTLSNRDIPDLTSHEILLIKERRGEVVGNSLTSKQKKAFKAKKDDKLEWEQGRDAIMVMFNSTVEKQASEIGARLEAGISGSTNMMFAAAKNLGVTDAEDLKKLRLAMLGWMLPNHDHSFYEIMMAADIQGVKFHTDPLKKGHQYQDPRNFAPVQVNTLRNLLPEKQFPSYFLSDTYKDVLANEVQDTPGLDKPKNPFDHNSPQATTARYKSHVESLGIRQAEVNALDERGMLEVIALSDTIKDTSFADETVVEPKALEAAKATNGLKFHYLREESSYRYLRHTYPVYAELWMAQLLNKHGKPCSGDHTLLQSVDPTKLGAVDSNIGARKQILVNHGAPDHLLQDMPQHLIDDLVNLNAVIDKLTLDGTKPISHEDNKDEYGKIFKTTFWTEIQNVYGRNMGGIWVILGRLFKHKHGDLIFRSIFNGQILTPEAKEMQEMGIPDKIARTLSAYTDAISDLNAVAKAIEQIAQEDEQQHITKLQALAATHSKLSAFVDQQAGANSFDMVVAAMAKKLGIDIDGNKHYRLLGRLATVLNTGEDITTPNVQDTNFQGSKFLDPLETARQTLENNLKKEKRAIQGSEFEQLDPVEIASINEYSKLGGMGGWQDAIDSKDTKDKGRYSLSKIAPRIQAAVAGLRKLPAYQGKLYNAQRGDLVNKPDMAMRIFGVGTLHRKENFLSTGKTVGGSFIPKKDYGVAWVIENSRSGKNIAPISTNYEEDEVLFPPGTAFIVTKVVDKSKDGDGYGKVWVYLDEV